MKKFLIKIKSNKIKILKNLIFLSIIIALYFIVFPIKIYVVSDNRKGKEIYPSEKISNKTTYSQTFISDIDYLSSIGIKLSTYEIENKSGLLNITLKNEKGKVLHNEKIKLSNIKDNEIYTINFNEIKKSKKKKYTITINYEKFNKNNSLAYWYTTTEINEKLKINNEKIEQEMYIILTGKSADYFIAWYPILIASILYSMLILQEGENNENKRKF